MKVTNSSDTTLNEGN